MKNRMFVGLVAAATALVLSSSLATAQEAYSANAIGVIKKSLPNGKQTLLSIPLDQETDEGEGFLFGSVPAISNLPDLSVATFWDESDQRWVTQSKTPKYGWGAATTRRITPGEAFFLKNNQSSNIELVVSGEVPADSSISQGLAGGIQALVANPYPVAMSFTNFTFASQMEDLSVATFWDINAQRWVSQSKTPKYGWGAATNRIIQPGEGFFLKPYSSNSTWTEQRPYTWPN